MGTFWLQHILPYLMLMNQHFVSLAVAMDNAFYVGALLDGKQELEAQRLVNQLMADAHRDYLPSMGMCVFGTNVRSLADAERRGEYTRFVMSQRAQDRELGHRNALGADGMHFDLRARMAQFKIRYCDTQQDGGELALLVRDQRAGTKARNADVNYTQLVDSPLTLDIDFARATAPPTDEETDIFALADNLYSPEPSDPHSMKKKKKKKQF